MRVTVVKHPVSARTHDSKKPKESRKEVTRKREIKPRQHSLETIKERAYKIDKGYCSVTCRLTTVCRDERVRQEIQNTARLLKQIQLEAWHLVNLHTLRCLEEEAPLPLYDATFFDHCCLGVLDESSSGALAMKNPELWTTIELNRRERKSTGCDAVSRIKYVSQQMYELRSQMVVNAGVMLRDQFRRRLRVCVQARYASRAPRSTKKEKKAHKAKMKRIVNDCYSSDPSSLPESLEMRAMLSLNSQDWGEASIPWPSRITDKSRIAFYVRLLWRFQQTVEARMDAVPGEKGVRGFTIFPYSTSFSAAHIKVNATTLFGICARIKMDKHVKMAEEWGLEDTHFDVRSFQRIRSAVMRAAFQVDQFETRRVDCRLTKDEFASLPADEKYDYAAHLFANQVTSDGYGASILLYRPKTAEEQQEEPPHTGTTGQPEFEPGYMPNVVVGLDPGMRTMCAAVREDLRPGHVRRRSKRKKRRKRSARRRSRQSSPVWMHELARPRHQNGRDIISVSAREYYHTASFAKFRDWHEGLKRQHPEYASVIKTMPSFKTARYDTYLERLRYLWSHLHDLLSFHAQRPFLKWRFLRERTALVALDAVAARIVPSPSASTCVGYENWRSRGGIKGHTSCPNKRLGEALKKRAKVVFLDEFKTSKCCSTCHRELSKVSYPVDAMLGRRKKQRGHVVARNRAEVQIELRKCHAVMSCDNASCDAKYWDRDENAAINILALLKCALLGLPRPAAFARAAAPS